MYHTKLLESSLRVRINTRAARVHICFYLKKTLTLFQQYDPRFFYKAWIANGCSKLKEIHLKNTPRLTDGAIFALAGITAAQMKPLMADLPRFLSGRLKPLKLGKCNLEKVYIKTIGENKITNASLLALSFTCANLQSVELIHSAEVYLGFQLFLQ